MMTLQAEVSSYETVYAEHVNAQWVRLLRLLGMNEQYTRCVGAELTTEKGESILDFLSGYCVYNMGHNHPKILKAVEEELHRLGPNMLQSHVPESAAELAAKLCALAGKRLDKVFFTSSGSEGIETVIKFSRAHTRRPGLLYAEGAFHGLTCGALSLMGDPWWREGFGPLLPDTESVPFDDLEALDNKLASRRFAAFVVEPVQAESGIRVPGESYLREAQALCHRHGTLFALDEVQTGLYRTGPFLAAHHFDLDPDMVVLAKALSGGLVPSGAVLMTDEIYDSIYSSLSRAFIHASTFGEGGLAMRAGLATLEVMETEKLGQRARVTGELLRLKLEQALETHEMVGAVRGLGMLNGIEFRAPRKLHLKIPFEGFAKLHPGMFTQMLVMRLFREKKILCQACGNNFMVLKVAPPLIVSEEQIDRFVSAMEELMELVHTSPRFWSEALRLMSRVVGV